MIIKLSYTKPLLHEEKFRPGLISSDFILSQAELKL
nr:MAG TPA: hypothetical protein [Caudoviricetes sp.]